MLYANYSGDIPVYVKDKDGNVMTTNVDGVAVPVEGTPLQGYSDAVEFKANISFNSGETQLAEYGLDVGSYNAIISADKGKFPIDEQTLIWVDSKPIYDAKTGLIKPESAEYKVVAIKTSLNEERFILKKRIEGKAGKLPSA